MRLKRLHVDNFRALETIDISFHPMTVIIGENDVGKTSCMLAIKALFETKKLEKDADFFMRDRDRVVVLEAIFDGASTTDDEASQNGPGDTLHIRCRYGFDQPRTIEVKSTVPKDNRLREIDTKQVGELCTTLIDLGTIDPNAKPGKPEAQKLLHAWVADRLTPDDFEESWESLKEVELTKLLPDFVLVPVSRDLESNLKLTESSLLGKLFRPLLKTALEGAEADANLSELRGRLKDGVRGRVDDLQSLLREQLNNESVALTHEVDLDPIKGITFDFGMDDERAKNIPLANRGAGVHNNLILSMFRLLARYGTKNFVLAMEEPENSLHPRGQREMLWALQSVAKTAQVICTTHSSAFLDLGRLEDNIVLARTSNGNTIVRSFSTNDVVGLRELLGIRISDALLSGGGNCAIIVEGPTELHAYPHFFRIEGHDSRSLGISIINAEGSDTNKINRLLMVLNVYGIPAVVVLDKNAAKTAEDLQRFVGGTVLACLKKVYLLKEGSFESYIPLEIAVAVLNERFEGKEIKIDDFDTSKDRDNELKKVLYERKGTGARFEHFKVEFGELAGRKMYELKQPLNDEIKTIVNEVAEQAASV